MCVRWKYLSNDFYSIKMEQINKVYNELDVVPSACEVRFQLDGIRCCRTPIRIHKNLTATSHCVRRINWLHSFGSDHGGVHRCFHHYALVHAEAALFHWNLCQLN